MTPLSTVLYTPYVLNNQANETLVVGGSPVPRKKCSSGKVLGPVGEDCPHSHSQDGANGASSPRQPFIKPIPLSYQAKRQTEPPTGRGKRGGVAVSPRHSGPRSRRHSVCSNDKAQAALSLKI